MALASYPAEITLNGSFDCRACLSETKITAWKADPSLYFLIALEAEIST